MDLHPVTNNFMTLHGLDCRLLRAMTGCLFTSSKVLNKESELFDWSHKSRTFLVGPHYASSVEQVSDCPPPSQCSLLGKLTNDNQSVCIWQPAALRILAVSSPKKIFSCICHEGRRSDSRFLTAKWMFLTTKGLAGPRILRLVRHHLDVPQLVCLTFKYSHANCSGMKCGRMCQVYCSYNKSSMRVECSDCVKRLRLVLKNGIVVELPKSNASKGCEHC